MTKYIEREDVLTLIDNEKLANLLVHNPWMIEKNALKWLKEEAKT